MTNKQTDVIESAARRELRSDILMKREISARQKLNYVPINFSDIDTVLIALSDEPSEREWRDIETHDGSTTPCMIAILDRHGHVEIAEKAEWEPGDIHEEWDEVEDGIKVKLWEEEDEGSWLTSWGAIQEPTHWQPLPSHPSHLEKGKADA